MDSFVILLMKFHFCFWRVIINWHPIIVKAFTYLRFQINVFSSEEWPSNFERIWAISDIDNDNMTIWQSSLKKCLLCHIWPFLINFCCYCVLKSSYMFDSPLGIAKFFHFSVSLCFLFCWLFSHVSEAASLMWETSSASFFLYEKNAVSGHGKGSLSVAFFEKDMWYLCYVESLSNL